MRGRRGRRASAPQRGTLPFSCSSEGGEPHRLMKGKRWYVLGVPVTLPALRRSAEHPPAHGMLSTKAGMETTPFRRVVNG